MARYLTLGTLTIGPGKRAVAEGIADHGVGLVSSQPGFISVRFFLDEATNVYGAVSEWESREAAEAADAVLTPGFTQAFGDHLEGEISSRIYEIYEPIAS